MPVLDLGGLKDANWQLLICFGAKKCTTLPVVSIPFLEYAV